MAFIGSIRDEVVDTFELAMALVEEIRLVDKALLELRYNVDTDLSGEEFLKAAARRRGYIIKGGEIDMERMASALLDDFRKGRLGKITLENADEYHI